MEQCWPSECSWYLMENSLWRKLQWITFGSEGMTLPEHGRLLTLKKALVQSFFRLLIQPNYQTGKKRDSQTTATQNV